MKLGFREEAMRITGGIGIDVVHDALGMDNIHTGIHSRKKAAACARIYGGASGLVATAEPPELVEVGSVFSRAMRKMLHSTRKNCGGADAINGREKAR